LRTTSRWRRGFRRPSPSARENAPAAISRQAKCMMLRPDPDSVTPIHRFSKVNGSAMAPHALSGR
jgi:hypothetical protein